MFTPTVISFAIAQATLSITTERSEWRNLFKDVSTALDMTGVNSYIKTLINIKLLLKNWCKHVYRSQSLL